LKDRGASAFMASSPSLLELLDSEYILSCLGLLEPKAEGIITRVNYLPVNTTYHPSSLEYSTTPL
jgi:hypothetical protein